MNILGITCTHDAAACLMVDGVIVADAAEERFSRVKHDFGYPGAAIDYCLSAGSITAQEIDVVAIAGHFVREVLRRFVLSPKQLAELAEFWHVESTMRQLIVNSGRRDFPHYIKRIELSPRCRLICVGHHLAHAAAAHFTRETTDRCVIATLDGIGDNVSTAIWIGEGNKISPVRSWGREASLGWFYGNVTEALGWQHGDGEGTTMGLAPYGDPKKVGDRLDSFHPVFANGELAAPHEFGPLTSISDHGNQHWHFQDAEEIRKIVDACGRENVAARAQEILEHQVLGLIRHWTTEIGVPRLACGGGVFLNVKLNQRVWYEGDLEEQWTYPNPGDAGLAVGASLYVWYDVALSKGPWWKGWRKSSPTSTRSNLETLYHGPSFSNEEIRAILDARRLDYHEIEDPSMTAARILAQGKVVAWFQGRMESGPRALGGRSILMAADKPENKDTLNSKVKFRERFRPFCPAILAEKREDYLRDSREEPFMITSFDIKPEKRNKVPAIVHVDGTVRPQTVRREVHARFYDLIKHFGDLTGEYVVINTSFNIKGEPIVCNPREALRCFFDTGIDALVIGNFLLTKRDPETMSI